MPTGLSCLYNLGFPGFGGFGNLGKPPGKKEDDKKKPPTRRKRFETKGPSRIGKKKRKKGVVSTTKLPKGRDL